MFRWSPSEREREDDNVTPCLGKKNFFPANIGGRKLPLYNRHGYITFMKQMNHEFQ